MDREDVFKVLGNNIRLQILGWLKEPEKNFPPQEHNLKKEGFANAVCVGSIQEKAGISQSTVSHYLDMLQRAGLLESARIGKWTYYRRNEKNIHRLADDIRGNL